MSHSPSTWNTQNKVRERAIDTLAPYCACLLFEHWVSSCPIHLGLLYRKKNPNCLWGEAGVLKSAWAVCGHHGKQTNTSSIQGQATVSMIIWYFKTPLVSFLRLWRQILSKKKKKLSCKAHEHTEQHQWGDERLPVNCAINYFFTLNSKVPRWLVLVSMLKAHNPNSYYHHQHSANSLLPAALRRMLRTVD